MNWQIEYIEKDDLLYIKTNGVLTNNAANAMVEDIVKASARYKCDNQIVDHRDTQFALKVIDYYERPNVNAGIGISLKWKIAMVFSKLTEDTQFMETVFRNRGYNFRQFDDVEEARKWVVGK